MTRLRELPPTRLDGVRVVAMSSDATRPRSVTPTPSSRRRHEDGVVESKTPQTNAYFSTNPSGVFAEARLVAKR